MTTAQERQLIARLQEGDDSAMRELADRYTARIFQLAMRHMRNREDAEEVTQDVLMKVYRKVGAFRGDSALSSWIYRITFNTAMSRLRTGRLARAVELDVEASRTDAEGSRPVWQVADWTHMPDEDLLRAQLREVVAGAIAGLPEIYRGPVVLRDIEGLSTEEASCRLNLKDQTLKSRLHRGRLLLREQLREFTSGMNLHRPTAAYT